MPNTFFDFLTARVQAANSLLCVGLDPRAETVEELLLECRRLIDTTADFAAAFKPNSAFFEQHGPEGMRALRDVIASVPEGIPVILDAKRGDIAETAEAYARAAFDTFGAHAVTVNPYLGGDAIAPFIARPEFGAFILCKTSNLGASEFQDVDIRLGVKLFEYIAHRARQWNTRNNVGLVVGATHGYALAHIRRLVPGMWFLVPGIGAQGGDLEKTLAAGLRDDGLGLLVNVSRSIAQAPNPDEEAERLRDAIRKYQVTNRQLRTQRARRETRIEQPYGRLEKLAKDLLTSGCVKFGQFTLKSGLVSPIYFDLRLLVSHPDLLRRVAQTYASVLAGLQFDRLAGIPYAGLPIATAVSLEMNRPLIYPRREAKDYGTKAAIEGNFAPGETAVVIDDLATTGDTKIETIQKLEAAGLVVRDIVVLIDREQGARQTLAEAGYRLHAIVTLRELLDEWRKNGAITRAQFQEVVDFLKAS